MLLNLGWGRGSAPTTELSHSLFILRGKQITATTYSQRLSLGTSNQSTTTCYYQQNNHESVTIILPQAGRRAKSDVSNHSSIILAIPRHWRHKTMNTFLDMGQSIMILLSIPAFLCLYCCLYVNVSVCMSVCVCVCGCVCVSVCLSHTHTHTNAHMYTHMHALKQSTDGYTQIHMYTSMCWCAHTHTDTHTISLSNTHTHTHTHILSHIHLTHTQRYHHPPHPHHSYPSHTHTYTPGTALSRTMNLLSHHHLSLLLLCQFSQEMEDKHQRVISTSSIYRSIHPLLATPPSTALVALACWSLCLGQHKEGLAPTHTEWSFSTWLRLGSIYLSVP